MPYCLSERPRSPWDARQLVSRAICETAWAGQRDAAVLGASEIATNAFVHAGAIEQMRVTVFDSTLRVETDDCGPGAPRARDLRPETAGGRGLAIVNLLASSWGVRRHDSAKTVWFEMVADSPPF